MAAIEETSSNIGNNDSMLDRLTRATNGLCLFSSARTNFTANIPEWQGDTVTQRLTTQIVAILYHPDSRTDYQKLPRHFTNLHEHQKVRTLLAEYEPGPHIDPEQLKVILRHLKFRVPQIDTGSIVVLLYRFIKTFLTLRRRWLKTAGELFGLLAYIERFKRLCLQGAGPSFPVQSEEFEMELLEISDRLETQYSALQEFKLSDSFGVHMRHLATYFQELKKEEERRQKKIQQATKKAQDDEKKRLELKRRNGRVAAHQLGPRMDVEMGDVQQQRILDMMTDTMQFELGIEAEE